MRPVQHVRAARSRRGALTVEMALITPVLLVLVFGILQVGYAFMVQHALQDVARQGCRMAILRNRSQSAVTTAVQDLLRREGITPAKTSSAILVNDVERDMATAVAGDQVCVRIRMSLSDAALFPGFFSNFTGTMQGSATMRCE